MRKRQILAALLLAAALTLTLAACGEDGAAPDQAEERQVTREEMEESATELSSEDMTEIEENVAKGLAYRDSYCIIRGYVESIHTDYCEIAPFFLSDSGIETIGPDFLILNAYLPEEELVTLEEDTQIAVIGHVSDVGEESITLDTVAGNAGGYALGMEMTRKAITMDQAFLYK